MGRILICATAIVGLTCSDGFADDKLVDAPLWQKDYTQAKAIAKRLNKPLFVVFR